MRRRFAATLAVAAALAAAGCGGDDEQAGETGAAPPATEAAPRTETEPAAPAATEAEPAETETAAEPEPEPSETEAAGSPEDQPGGAGDEEPARTLALFTGEDGRIVPRVVRVPAFISVRVELRSADGREYGLTLERGGASESIGVGGGLGSVSTTIDGLRPGEAVVGRATGAARNGVRIEATAEPGP